MFVVRNIMYRFHFERKILSLLNQSLLVYNAVYPYVMDTNTNVHYSRYTIKYVDCFHATGCRTDRRLSDSKLLAVALDV